MDYDIEKNKLEEISDMLTNLENRFNQLEPVITTLMKYMEQKANQSKD